MVWSTKKAKIHMARRAARRVVRAARRAGGALKRTFGVEPLVPTFSVF